MVTSSPSLQDSGTRRIVFGLVSTVAAVVLLFSYRTATPEQTATSVVESAPAESASGPGSPAIATYTGDSVSTRWGNVTAQITLADGAITQARAVEVPSGNQRDVEINSRAVPQLNAEVLAAQSADIDTVSGATVTSDGYRSSLQSAIDAAGL